MMLSTQLAALALGAVTLAASGCGGSSKSATATAASPAAQTSSPAATSIQTTAGSGARLSRAAFIAKADAICARMNAKRGLNQIKTKKDFGVVLPRIAAYEQVEAAELAALKAPAALARDWKQIVDDVKSVAEDTAKAGQYAKAHNGIRGISAFVATGTRLDHTMLAIAHRDGFAACAETS